MSSTSPLTSTAASTAAAAPGTVPGTADGSTQRVVPFAAVVLAAGSGSRVGATVNGLPVNKVLLPLAGVPLLVHSVRHALAAPGLTHLVVVARPGEERVVAAALTPHLGDAEVRLVGGGDTRHASEWAGIRALAPEIEAGEVEVVAVHDGARPLADAALYGRVAAAAAEHGGAVPVAPARTLLTLDGSPAPEALAAVQTPQAFAAAALLASYRAAEVDGFTGTDTASCLERYAPDARVVAVASGSANIKVTFPEDVTLAEALLARR